MHRSLLGILVDPFSKTPLEIESANDIITEGTLRSREGRSYPVINGIPRFVLGEDLGQQQTECSFGFKWKLRETYDSPPVHDSRLKWLLQRYGFPDAGAMRHFFAGRRRILDAGCGSGFGASLWMDASWRGNGSAEWVGVDISDAIDLAQGRLGAIPGTHFIQADIMQLPFRGSAFDTIFSDGVLHHTPSTENALKALVPLLEPDGQIMFYVYRKKGPVREFADDHIRGVVSALPPQEAWDALRALTRLGQALAGLHAEVDVPEDIPYLGIQAGHYDVQRLIYWHFAKLYWNDAFSFEENHHVNFDWYHPCYAHRQTEDNVRRWCAEAGLAIVHFDSQESGFTVRAVRE